MKFFGSHRRAWQRSIVIISAVLVCLMPIFWQFFQDSRLTLSSRFDRLQKPNVISKEEINPTTEPIQPIPLKISLDENKVSLGKILFEDTRLSEDNKISCVSCHNLQLGGVDRRVRSVGVHGNLTYVNTSTVFNALFNFRLNWNGMSDDLTDHLDRLMTIPKDMGVEWKTLIDKLQGISQYRKAFDRIYPDGLTADNIKDAIVAYEMSLYTPNSPFDRFLRGDKQALTTSEKEGYKLFKNYGCISCHQGINVGGNMFQRFGVMGDYFAERGNITQADLGRFNVTKDETDRYVFRVPSLRNVELTPPYFHDGSAETLEKATAIMMRYQLGRPLSKEQIDLIVEFLRTLTGEYQFK
jgi:cytochrome c peroxidase